MRTLPLLPLDLSPVMPVRALPFSLLACVLLSGCGDADAPVSPLLADARQRAEAYIGEDVEQTPLECPDLEPEPGVMECTSTVEGESVTWLVRVPDPSATDPGAQDVDVYPEFGSASRTVEWTIRRTYRNDYGVEISSIECPMILDPTNVSTVCQAQAGDVAFDVQFEGTALGDFRYGASAGIGFGRQIEESVIRQVQEWTGSSSEVTCDAPRVFRASTTPFVSMCQANVASTGQRATIRFEIKNEAGDIGMEIVETSDGQ